MKDTFIYNYSFADYSVELELELDVYIPRNETVDDVAEIEILSAINRETGKPFNLDIIDQDDVALEYSSHLYE